MPTRKQNQRGGRKSKKKSANSSKRKSKRAIMAEAVVVIHEEDCETEKILTEDQYSNDALNTPDGWDDYWEKFGNQLVWDSWAKKFPSTYGATEIGGDEMSKAEGDGGERLEHVEHNDECNEGKRHQDEETGDETYEDGGEAEDVYGETMIANEVSNYQTHADDDRSNLVISHDDDGSNDASLTNWASSPEWVAYWETHCFETYNFYLQEYSVLHGKAAVDEGNNGIADNAKVVDSKEDAALGTEDLKYVNSISDTAGDNCIESAKREDLSARSEDLSAKREKTVTHLDEYNPTKSVENKAFDHSGNCADSFVSNPTGCNALEQDSSLYKSEMNVVDKNLNVQGFTETDNCVDGDTALELYKCLARTVDALNAATLSETPASLVFKHLAKTVEVINTVSTHSIGKYSDAVEIEDLEGASKERDVSEGVSLSNGLGENDEGSSIAVRCHQEFRNRCAEDVSGLCKEAPMDMKSKVDVHVLPSLVDEKTDSSSVCRTSSCNLEKNSDIEAVSCSYVNRFTADKNSREPVVNETVKERSLMGNENTKVKSCAGNASGSNSGDHHGASESANATTSNASAYSGNSNLGCSLKSSNKGDGNDEHPRQPNRKTKGSHELEVDGIVKVGRVSQCIYKQDCQG